MSLFYAYLNHRVFVWLHCFIFTGYGPTTCFQCKLHLTSCNIVFSLSYCFKLLNLQYFCKIKSLCFFFFWGLLAMADVEDVLGNITKIELSHLVVPNEGFISWEGVDGHGKWHNSKTSTIIHGKSCYMD